MGERLLTNDALAERLHVHPNTTEHWRLKGEGPPWIRVGRLVRYRPEDVEEWLTRNRAQSTSESRAT